MRIQIALTSYNLLLFWILSIVVIVSKAELSSTWPLLSLLCVMSDTTLRSNTCPRPDLLTQATPHTAGTKAAPGSPVGTGGKARVGSGAS